MIQRIGSRIPPDPGAKIYRLATYRVVLEGMARVEHRVLLVALAKHAHGELRGIRVVPHARVRKPRPLGSAGEDRTTKLTQLIAMVRHDFFPARQVVFC